MIISEASNVGNSDVSSQSNSLYRMGLGKVLEYGPALFLSVGLGQKRLCERRIQTKLAKVEACIMREKYGVILCLSLADKATEDRH